MRQTDVWSISLGRWGRLPVRLHIFFVFFALFTLYLAWIESTAGESVMGLAAVSIAILFFSVVLHELGHYFAASRLGGNLDTIVLGPLGGLRHVQVPHDAQSELLAVLAGPMTSLAICITCLLAVLSQDQVPPSKLDLLHPLAPSNLILRLAHGGDLNLSDILRLTCWINWWLLVVNLIPAFPFDGGRACLAFVQSIRPQMKLTQAIRIVAAMAWIVAAGLLAVAFFSRHAWPDSVVPSWLALSMLAVFVVFSARVEEQQVEEREEQEEMFGYDFSQGYTSLERSGTPPAKPPGILKRFWIQFRQRQEQRQREVELAEEARVDAILARLHEEGLTSLSVEERALLKRVSARYRSREKS